MSSLEIYLQENIDQLHPSELAKLLKNLDDEEFKGALELIPKEMIGDIALELPDRYFSDIVDSFTAKDLADAVCELESDDQTDFIQELEEVDDKIAKDVFDQLDSQTQDDILELKRYNEQEAGSYMQKEVYSASLDKNVHDVIREFARLRKAGELENVQFLFVIDSSGKLHYGIGLDSLLIFDFSKTLRENIEDSPDKFKPIFSYDIDNIEDIVKKFQEYDLSSMPIISRSGTLLGRITSDDIYDIISKRATDQMYNLAGVDDEVEEDENIIRSGRSRAIWLGLNLLTAILASLVIGIFTDTLQSLVALAVLMPIVASMGGNAGTQSLTIVVRQLALGNIAKRDAFKTIKKEVFIALVNGMVFAVIMGMIAYIWFDKGILGVVIGLSMIITLLSAGFFGSVVPLLLKRYKVDPAIGSSVVLTTLTDLIGFFSFLGLATIILI
jgi:magnesium transporter